MELNIALLAGDGIGPEVIDQAVKVCDAIANKYNHQINWTSALTGAAEENHIQTKHMISAQKQMLYYLVLLVIQDLTMTLLQKYVQNKVY